MRVLIGCEFSGVVRRAFEAYGHDAWSCDLLPSEDSSPKHLQVDLLSILSRGYGWDLTVFHPPCTHLARSGARYWRTKQANGSQQAALDFVQRLLSCEIPLTALENPVGLISTRIRKPDQIFQPWFFGHGEVKATCLWLKGLPKLEPTAIVGGRKERVFNMSPGPNRWKERSRTLPAVAWAMAQQWGKG